ncbi:hypothetical protein KUTeg_000838 [Tegillarca granosa]|uniref:Uncharacterized protein n=1 Tax=Tegillarca granosa TaxID=220873 RepID=A0ABQ9FZP2_TEGGR|nr:hypothetical protein KUTeg_000838 [Tegillarca granosa]
MIGLGHVDCSFPELAIFLLMLSSGLRGFRYVGFIENALDIDPHYATVIFGLANVFGGIGGYLSTLVVGKSHFGPRADLE